MTPDVAEARSRNGTVGHCRVENSAIMTALLLEVGNLRSSDSGELVQAQGDGVLLWIRQWRCTALLTLFP
jgi:hypothetical protein